MSAQRTFLFLLTLGVWLVPTVAVASKKTKKLSVTELNAQVTCTPAHSPVWQMKALSDDLNSWLTRTPNAERVIVQKVRTIDVLSSKKTIVKATVTYTDGQRESVQLSASPLRGTDAHGQDRILVLAACKQVLIEAEQP